LTDASDGGADFQTAQVSEPPPPPEEPPAPPPAVPPESADPVVTPKGTVAGAVAPNGVLPGDGSNGLGNPRTMPASDDPNSAASQFVNSIYNGQMPVSVRPIGDPGSGAFVAKMPDGTNITFRPAGQAGDKTALTTATVEVNSDALNSMNSGSPLELKFPKK
jgi:filamentous hemagglutinin